MSYMGPQTKCGTCGHMYYPIYADGKATASGCPVCNEAAEDKQKREYFEKLDAMTLEERVRRIEEMQFDQHHRQRNSGFTKY